MRIMVLAPGYSVHTERFLHWLQDAGYEILFIDNVKPSNLDPNLGRFIPYPSLRNISMRYIGKRKDLDIVPSIPRSRHLDKSSPKDNVLIPRLLLTKISELYRSTVLAYQRRSFKPDIIHLHYVDERAYDCYLARLRPFVVTCWGSDINQHFNEISNVASSRKTGYVLAWADYVFADSQEVLDRCSHLAGKKVQSNLQYFGINTEIFRPEYLEVVKQWRQKLNIPSDTHILLSIRAWNPIYRHELILEAFAQAKKSLPFPIILLYKVFLAEDESYTMKINQLAEKLGVVQDLRWISEIPNEQMPEIYALSDAIINFPLSDGFPVSFIEAAACKKPIISNCLPAYKGTIFEEIAHMTSTDTATDLAKAIIDTFQENPEILAQKMEKGRSWAEKFGDEKSCQEKIISVYERIYRERR